MTTPTLSLKQIFDSGPCVSVLVERVDPGSYRLSKTYREPFLEEFFKIDELLQCLNVITHSKHLVMCEGTSSVSQCLVAWAINDIHDAATESYDAATKLLPTWLLLLSVLEAENALEAIPLLPEVCPMLWGSIKACGLDTIQPDSRAWLLLARIRDAAQQELDKFIAGVEPLGTDINGERIYNLNEVCNVLGISEDEAVKFMDGSETLSYMPEPENMTVN